ncbi:MAG: enoyl-CoA hydratase/isomerase family protein [Sphingobacteriales bacterium]|nr:MAG: enoyl-CoA hydratase/isomerase family protein [Sphingobacteriales bacterium]
MNHLSISFENEVAIILLNQRARYSDNLQQMLKEFNQLLDEIDHNLSVKAVVIGSSQKDFSKGVDFTLLYNLNEPGTAEHVCRQAQKLLMRIEKSRKPVVAAIHGAAKGAGLEIALACHYRIATNSLNTVFAMPDIKMGLLPGGGATQRLPKLIGIRAALDMMLNGKNIHAYKAVRIGLVNRLIHPVQLMNAAVMQARKMSTQKWKKTKSPPSFDKLINLNRYIRSKVFDRVRYKIQQTTYSNYPAPFKILECIEIGCRFGEAMGYAAEIAKYDELVVHPVTKNLIWLQKSVLEKKKRLETSINNPVKTIAVVGSGFMGGGIAEVSVMNGFNVILTDIYPEKCALAMQSVWASLTAKVKKRTLRSISRWKVMNRLQAQSDFTDFNKAQIVIEAVYEDLELKQKLLAFTESQIQENCIYASNTSAIPIHLIAKQSKRPEQVIGMHFFSPVPKMSLLEIIVTPQTADWVVNVAIDLGIKQGKTCIVVKDSPGFYTTRIITTYLNEALCLLEDGAEIWQIDECSRQLGFPVGPFTLIDEIGIDSLNAVLEGHLYRFLAQTKGAGAYTPSSLPTLLLNAGFKGRKNRKGFYRYHSKTGEKTSTQPDEAVNRILKLNKSSFWFKDKHIRQRLMMMMTNEAARCLEEGIIHSPVDGDLGAVLGLGYPAFTGGPFHYLDSIGCENAVIRLENLSQRFGNRFLPANILYDYAKTGVKFFPG